MSTARIELLSTVGTLWREGQGIELQNNVWIIGDDEEAIVIDAAHDAEAIRRAVSDRIVHGILLTHGHEDHVNAARDAADLLDAELFLHPADRFLWDDCHPGTQHPRELAEGDSFAVAGTSLNAVHTPGHTPGSVCLIAPEQGVVFSGDTLFHGGPGATRWEYSSFEQIIDSIQNKLFTLPGETTVLTGHGEATTVTAEHAQLHTYIERGW